MFRENDVSGLLCCTSVRPDLESSKWNHCWIEREERRGEERTSEKRKRLSGTKRQFLKEEQRQEQARDECEAKIEVN